MPPKKYRLLPAILFTVLLCLMPWAALLFAEMSIGLVVLCAACSIVGVLVLILMLQSRRRFTQTLQEQIRLYLSAIEAPEQPDKQPVEELLRCLGETAAAQNAANVQNTELTARFLTEWSKKTAASLEAMQASQQRVGVTLPVEERLLAQEVNTLRCLTEQLMRYFDCTSDCSLYRIQQVELTRVLSDAIIRRSDELKERKIGLRRSAAKMRVISDPVLLAGILDELLDNAIRHTPTSGAIGVSCREVDGFAEVVVEDVGSGIPADELPRVFERGFVGRSEGAGRAGLGLFIVRAYCELLGHNIQIRSVEGRGTQAVLRLKPAPAKKEKEKES